MSSIHVIKKLAKTKSVRVELSSAYLKCYLPHTDTITGRDENGNTTGAKVKAALDIGVPVLSGGFASECVRIYVVGFHYHENPETEGIVHHINNLFVGVPCGPGAI